MSQALLKIRGLRASVTADDTQILHGIDLDIMPGEIHVLMGPNGAGKSTLGNCIMGNPAYTITDGTIEFNGQDITHESTDKRAKAGLFLSFQNPIEVPGITLSTFIKTASEEITGDHVRLWKFRKQLESNMEMLQMDKAYLDRDLNVGFSGGEKKKAEILQLLTLQPKLAILDETDSGLDVDAVRTVSQGVEQYMKESGRALIIITHSTRILEALKVNYTHVLVDGKLVATGDASIIDDINQNGFEKYLQN
ncbi:MAG: Fe-S cluster assembly ATPase SufC [Lachnospiraceae bacterium]|nr:Fe-S cluster assembly ATPase SufC [Lachnospiraceae bacterium]